MKPTGVHASVQSLRTTNFVVRSTIVYRIVDQPHVSSSEESLKLVI